MYIIHSTPYDMNGTADLKKTSCTLNVRISAYSKEPSVFWHCWFYIGKCIQICKRTPAARLYTNREPPNNSGKPQ